MPHRTEVSKFRAALPAPLRRLADVLAMDRVVALALFGRVWGLLSAPLIAALTFRFLTLKEQGLQYTFASWIGSHMLFEMGFGIVILNFCSHEWVHLRLGAGKQIEGDSEARSRLRSLAHIVCWWFLAASLVYGLAVGGGGHLFFSRESVDDISWQGVWWSCVVLMSLALATSPLVAILEGCGQIVAVMTCRLAGQFFGVLLTVAIYFSGGGLWALIGAPLGGVGAVLVLLFVYRAFFFSLRKEAVTHEIDWRTELLPMQWRVAVNNGAAALASAVYIPMVFHFLGEEQAGRIGLTFSIVTTLSAASQAWLQSITPRAGMLVSSRRYAELNALFIRSFFVSWGLLIVGCVCAVLALEALTYWKGWAGHRMLPLHLTLLFMLAAVFRHIPNTITVYLRAHKVEVLVKPGVLTSVVQIVLSFVLLYYFGMDGMAWAWVLVGALVATPWYVVILQRCRKSWHDEEVQPVVAEPPSS